MSDERTDSASRADESAACVVCGSAHAAFEPCDAFLLESSGTISLVPLERLIAQTAPHPATVAPALGPDPLIGREVGNFTLTRRLGGGGMGTVYLGEHRSIGSKVAVKLLHEHLAEDPAAVERFYAEARAVNLVGHPNIVSIFDIALLPPRRHYLVMELLEGDTLVASVGKPMDPARLVRILAQVCDALAAAHAAGVVHRDLKPENVFLVERQSHGEFVKLVDFGVAKLAHGISKRTAAGLVLGTPEFMAPEQWTGEPIDGRADLYSVGLIGYLLATGRLPFEADNLMALFVAHREKPPRPIAELRPDFPPALAAVLLRALAKTPAERFADAAAMREALVAASLAKVAPPPPEPTSPAAVAAPAAVKKTFRLSVRRAGREAVDVEAVDLSRGGAFVASAAPPPLFERVTVGLRDREASAEVVRHVTAEQAKAWGMAEGYALQFTGPDAGFRAAVDAALAGDRAPAPPARPAVADPALDSTLKRLATRGGDPYALAGLPFDCDCGDLRMRLRQLTRELEAFKAAPLPDEQQARLKATLERIAAAMLAVGTPHHRAEYDAEHHNFRGVARCLAAGLSVTDLESLRRAWLAKHPGQDSRAHITAAAANPLEQQGDVPGAAEALERALAQDPLSIDLHQRYWTLKRRTSAARSPSR